MLKRKKNYRRLITLIGMLLVMPILLSAQNNIDLELLQPVSGEIQYNVFYISDIDPGNSDLQPVVFQFSLQNLTQEEINYYFRLSLTWNNQTLITPSQGIITPKSPLGPNELMILSNRDVFTDNNQYFSSSLKVNDLFNNSPNFEDIVLQTSKLPDGNYDFLMELYDSNDVYQGNFEVRMTILSATSITLLNPGVPFSDGFQYIQTNLPHFNWFSNLDNFTLRVFEVPDNMQSLNQLENTIPYFVEEVDFNNFTYPSNAPLLMTNTLYAWQVISGLITPLGLEDSIIRSDFYFFKIADEDAYSSIQNSLFILLNTVDNDIADTILSLIQEGGFSLNGNFQFNFVNTGTNQTGIILNKILSGELSISDIELID